MREVKAREGKGKEMEAKHGKEKRKERSQLTWLPSPRGEEYLFDICKSSNLCMAPKTVTGFATDWFGNLLPNVDHF